MFVWRQNLSMHSQIRRLVFFGFALLGIAGSIGWAQEANAQGRTLIQPSQVACGTISRESYQQFVPMPDGTELNVHDYCQARSTGELRLYSGDPSLYSGGQAAVQVTSDSPSVQQQWGNPYAREGNICRDRQTIDTVCVTPSSAQHLRWTP